MKQISNRKQSEINEGEESPLKAMTIARRQSILN